jgi:hypothetical protein
MPRSWRACWRGRRQNQIGGSRVGIQESRLASNDFKKAAERVRERWALGESKPVNAFFRGAAVAILQHFKEYHRTHAYTHTQSRTLLDTAPGVGTGACGGSPAGEADCESEWLHAGSGWGRQPRSPLGSIRTGGHRVPISIERVRRALGRCYRSHARRTHAPYPPSPRTRRRCHSTPRATVAVRSAARS